MISFIRKRYILKRASKPTICKFALCWFPACHYLQDDHVAKKLNDLTLFVFKPRVRLGQKTETRTKYQIHTEFTMLNSRYVGSLHLTILRIT
jgi:hypothetical protein